MKNKEIPGDPERFAGYTAEVAVSYVHESKEPDALFHIPSLFRL